MNMLLENEATLGDVAAWERSIVIYPWSSGASSTIDTSSNGNSKGPSPISAAAGKHSSTVQPKTDVPQVMLEC